MTQHQVLDLPALKVKAAYALGVYLDREQIDLLIEIADAASEWLEDWRGPAKRGGKLELDAEPEAAHRLAAALGKQ